MTNSNFTAQQNIISAINNSIETIEQLSSITPISDSEDSNYLLLKLVAKNNRDILTAVFKDVQHLVSAASFSSSSSGDQENTLDSMSHH